MSQEQKKTPQDQQKQSGRQDQGSRPQDHGDANRRQDQGAQSGNRPQGK